ncbi:MAG: Ig domain-containing protein, partial [Clostridia bacterium]|nr:Ig domain-containing protein [Clostridia bacterium]
MKKLRHSLVFTVLLSLIAALITACGGGSTVKISLNKSAATVMEGNTIELVATLEGTEGTVEWKSDAPSIATVNGYGLVTGIKAGTANITAKVGDKSATCVVTVVVEQSVKLDRKTVSSSIFDDVQLNATVKNITGSVIWTTSDPTIATVSDDGLVSALSAGVVTVTATVGGKSDSCEITFTAPDSGSTLAVTTEMSVYTVRKGDSLKIDAYVVIDGETEIAGGVFAYTPQDPSVATVNADGTIVPVAYGTTTVTVSGTVKGFSVTSATVTVNVRELVRVNSGFDGDNVNLYLTAGTTENPVSYTINATATIDGESATGGTFEYTTNDTDVVSVTGNVINAVGIGIAQINVRYTSANGESDQTVLRVIVSKSEITFSEELSLCNFNDNDVSGINFNGEITSVTVAGEQVAFALEGSTLRFTEHNATTGKGVDVIFETDTEKYICEAYIIDFAVSNKAELVEAFNHASEGKTSDQNQAANYTYIVLTNDIDMGGDYIPNGWYYFSGTLDGQGHTINDITAYAGIWLGLYHATIKNIGFINVKVINNDSGLLAAAATGNSIIDNVFIQGALGATSVLSNNAVGAVNWVQDGSVVQNSVFMLDASILAGTDKAVYAYATVGAGADNSYFVVPAATAYTNSAAEGEGMYTSIEAFKADSADILASLSSEYWEVYNGMLIFKSVKTFVSAPESISITNAETTVIAGSSLAVTTDTQGVKLTLKNAIAGVTLEGNVLTVADTVAGNTEITVVANYENVILGVKLTAEKVFTVKVAETVNETNVQVIAKNKETNFSYDLSSYGFGELDSVKFNGSDIEYTFAEGVVTIAKGAFASTDANVNIVA